MASPALPFFRVNAFTNRIRGGNPAAVCPLEEWLPDETMQALAAENDLSETAFFVPKGEHFELRWFTPTSEVELCGHATLASGFVVLLHTHPEREVARFHTHSGPLEVREQNGLLALDLPAHPAQPVDTSPELVRALGHEPVEVHEAASLMAVYPSEADVAALEPDMGLLSQAAPEGLIATAPGDDCDFVSRYFAPTYGVPEDPVTGAAHCTLTPYWARRLDKQELFGRQISARGGELRCTDAGERVIVAGKAVLYLRGTCFAGETLP